MDPSFIFDWVVGLLVLTGLEIILGIDNIVLLTILVEKLPDDKKPLARQLGLGLALVARIVLLAMAVWLTKLTDPIFSIFAKGFSIKDLILIFGGLFLLGKATTEIFNFVEMKEHHEEVSTKANFSSVIGQIIVFDLIFSLDSVLTAVGLSKHLMVMVLAVIIAIIFMMVFAKVIGEFVESNPGIKMLALSFLVLIGVLLMAEGFGSHMNRGYVYFAMAFSLGIELLNRRRRNKSLKFVKKVV